MDKASLEVLLGQGLSLEEIGRRFDPNPSTVAYWMRKHGLEAVNAEKHAAWGGIARERLEALVEGGLSIAQIAEEEQRSNATVRPWLRRYGLTTQAAARAAETTAAKGTGLRVVDLRCRNHGRVEFVICADGSYRCRRCRSESAACRRRKVKQLLVAETGGCCVICGYSRCLTALAFLHVDPSAKRLAISQEGVTLSLDTIRAEARKCVLLCANCHAEIESGAIDLPDTVAPASIRLE